MAAPTSYSYVSSSDDSQKTKRRSALGVGVSTLVTIMVILLLAAFSVLSLVSARSNLHLSEMTATRAEVYYAADSEATQWYADLDSFAASLTGNKSSFDEQLVAAGYDVEVTSSGEVRVMNSFSINNNRNLMITIAINEDKTTIIRQWQS